MERVVESVYPLGGLTPAQTAGYQPYSGYTSQRDLDPWSWDKAQRLAFAAWLASPYGRRITQLNADYIVGDGIGWEAQHPLVEELMTKFWSPAWNNLDLKIPTWGLELGLYGEQIWLVNRGANDVLRLGSLDPTFVREVETDPEDASTPIRIHACWKNKAGADVERSYPVIRWTEDDSGRQVLDYDEKAGRGKPIGVIYTRVNVVSQSIRGTPDLMPVLDLIDQHRKFMFTLIERAQLANYMLWVVKVKGQGSVKKYRDQLMDGGLKPGTLKIVNEGVLSWELQSAKLDSLDQKTMSELFEKQILIGAGWQPHHFANPENTNRSTGERMDRPTERRLMARQGVFCNSLEMAVQLQLQIARSTRLAAVPDEKLGVALVPSPINEHGDLQVVERLEKVTRVLVMAETSGWIDHTQASALWRVFASQTGTEVPKGEVEPERVSEAVRMYRNLEMATRHLQALPARFGAIIPEPRAAA